MFCYISLRLVYAGIADIQEGEVKENELKADTTGIHRMSFSKDPETKKVSLFVCFRFLVVVVVVAL